MFKLCKGFILLCILVVGLAVACQPPLESTLVVVRLHGVTGDVQSVSVDLILNDQPREKGIHPFNKPLNTFGIEFPNSTRGNLRIKVTALQDQCAVASGVGQATLSGQEQVEVTIPLTMMPSKLCTLTVTKQGAGSVTSQPTGIDCGARCSFEFPYGSKVTLTATAEQVADLPLWGGTCKRQSSTSCEITVTGPLSATVDFTPKVCVGLGWCWENPLPQGNAIIAVSVVSPNLVYAVGVGGTVLKWDGAKWISLNAPATGDLRAVWASGPDNVWVTGGVGVILRWNGTSWLTLTPSALVPYFGIWGTGPNDVWIVGDISYAQHWTGTKYDEFTTGSSGPRFEDLNAVWGSSATDVWAVGNNGLVVRWNGMAWSIIDAKTTETLRSVWGSAQDDIWIAGGGNKEVLSRWDGSSFTSYAVNGPPRVNHVFAASRTDAWGLGSKLLRWNGMQWTEQSYPFTDRGFFLTGSGSQNVWSVIGTAGELARWDGMSWRKEPPLPAERITASLAAGWTSDVENAWAVGEGGTVARWNGVAWRAENIQGKTTRDLLGAWGFSKDNVWVVGREGTSLNWNGTTWNRIDTGTSADLRSVYGSDPNDVWAVGTQGTILRWQGSAWVPVPSGTTETLNGVAKVNDSLLSVGNKGTLLRWSGTSWQSLSAGTMANLNALSGPAGLIAGDGVLLADMAGTWTAVLSDADVVLTSLYGTKVEDTWAAGSTFSSGGKGCFVHWNGIKWEVAPNVTSGRIQGVFGVGTERWAVGIGGAILHRWQ